MSSSTDSPSQPQILPSKVPNPTGNLLHDSIESAKHVTDLPCGRNALLAGIASGTGMGFIRGMTAHPWVAGNWAVGTAVIIAGASWHVCQYQYAAERKKVAQVMESMPKRTLNDSSSSSSSLT